MSNYLNDLHNNGFVHLINPLSEKEKDVGLNSIKSEGIDYTKLKYFIDNYFLKKVNETFGWDSIYLKFRFSNFNNSSDASTLHNDIYNFSNIKIMPIYTALIYFDEAIIEIIPKSHIKNNLSSLELYNNRIKVKVHAGDMFIFHANLYHRGIFYNSPDKNRRLLQVFDIFPNITTYNKYNKRFISVNTSKGIMSYINRLSTCISNNELLNEITNFFGFILTNNSLQQKLVLSDISNKKKHNNFVGYVPGKTEYIEKDKIQHWNVNIIVKDHNVIYINNQRYKTFMIILFILITLTIFYIIKNKIYYK